MQGVLETALYVKDVAGSAEFYRRVFGFEELLRSERLIALDVSGRDVLLLFQEGATGEAFETPGGVIPGHGTTGRNHLAFGVTRESLQEWEKKLEEEGVAIESRVTWEGGAESVYFRDPDEHLVELITPGFWRNY